MPEIWRDIVVSRTPHYILGVKCHYIETSQCLKVLHFQKLAPYLLHCV
jgi:hypothetical protein